MEPELLLLDEPFSALDAFTRASLQRDVRSIAKKLGFNLIIVTHDIDEAILMADRAVIMAGAPGKIVTEFEVPCLIRASVRIKEVQAMRSRLMDAFHSAAGKPAGADEHGEVDVEADSESVTQHA
jgi:ABC-type nitrate/sulfonate/bicarbonate transport system ATPase subunit